MPDPGAVPIVAVDWLRGIRVLEVTTGVAAPLVGRVLGELGAEVTKLESRSKPDVNRTRVPRPSDPEGYPAHEAFQLLHEANAGKRDITLNLKSVEGKQLFVSLLQEVDVFVENFVPGWLERLGFTMDGLLEQCPRLVILSASGYGQTGPLRTQRAYAPVMTALAGIEGLIGYADGEVMGCSALALADLNCSFYGVLLVMSALHGRRDTGRGQHVDLSQTEACVSLIGEAFVEQQLGVRPAVPRGNDGPDGQRWELLPAAGVDRWVAAGSGPSHREAGDGDGDGDEPGVPAAADRGRPDRDALVRRLRERGLECAPVLTPDEVVLDERFARGAYLQQVAHPLIGPLSVTSVPWRLDGAVPAVAGPAPLLGQDNEATFRRLLDDAVYDDYERRGVFH